MKKLRRKKYAELFESAKRNNSDEMFVRKKTDEYEDLNELIQDIHNALHCGLPDDWIYGEIWEAFEVLEENDIEDLSIEADCYHHQLLKWFSQCNCAPSCCDEALEEGLLEGVNEIWKIISGGQWFAKDRIYRMVYEFIQEDEEEEETEE